MADIILTPDMTSNTTPHGVASVSHSSYGSAWYTLDRNTGNYWYSSVIPLWLKYEYLVSVTVTRVRIIFYSTSYEAEDFTFESSHSNDFAGEQSILYTRTGNTASDITFDIPIPNQSEKRYYRLNFTLKRGSYVVVKEWYMYGFTDNKAIANGALTVPDPTMKTFSSTDTAGSFSIDILRTEEVENTGGCNAGRVSGPFTRNVDGSNFRLPTNSKIDTRFKLPTNHDWIMLEVYNVNGVVGDVGDTYWTDRIPTDIVAHLVSRQDVVDDDVKVTSYDCKASRYYADGNKVDTYVGNEATTIAPEGTGIPVIVPSENWLITKDVFAPDAPVLAITTIDGNNAHQIEIISPVAQEVQLLDTSTGVVVDSGTATTVTLNVPDTGDIRTYQVYCKGDTTQVKFPGSAKHSSCNFARAASITTLQALYVDGSNVTSFSWNGECNATSAYAAWAKCDIQNFPTIPMPYCTDFSYAWEYFTGTFDGAPDTSAGTNFYRAFYNFSGTNIPAIDLRLSTNVVEIALGSSAAIDTFNVTGKTSFLSMFQGFTGTLVSLDTSSGTNFERMFQSYSGAQIPALDMRAATVVQYMFNACLSIYTSLNTTGVTNFSNLFYQYNVAETLPTIDTSSGTNFTGMFQYANGGAVSYIDIRNGTSFSNFVYQSTRKFLAINTTGRTSLNSVFYYYYYTGDFPLIDTASCTDWDYAFRYSRCNFATNGIDMSAATTAYYCFASTTGPIGDLDLRSLGTSEYTFRYATGQILSLNTSDMANFDNMFHDYYYTGNLPFFDTSSGTTFYYMLHDCKAKLVSSMSTGAGVNFSYMFYGWDGQAGSIMPDMDMRNGTNFNNMFNTITLPLGTLNTIGVTNFTGMFRGYYGAVIPNVNTSTGTNYYEYLAYSSATFTVPYINVGASVQSMLRNYTGATPLSLDISNAGSVESLFYDCVKEVVSLNVTGKASLYALFNGYDYSGAAPVMDTSLCTNFSAMFQGANFSSIPVLNTSNGTNFHSMFESYQNAALSIGLDFSKSADSTEAFYACKATITQLHLAGSIGVTTSMFNAYSGASIPSLDLNTVASGASTFYECHAPFAGTVDVSLRTNCVDMFRYYKGPAFPHLDLTSLTYKITTSSDGLFNFATAPFTSINLTGVVALDYIFYDYDGTSIPAINTDFGSTFNYMFAACDKLICLTNVNTANSTTTTGMLDTTTAMVAPDATAKAEILVGSVWVNPGSCP